MLETSWSPLSPLDDEILNDSIWEVDKVQC